MRYIPFLALILAGPAQAVDYQSEVVPILKKYCVSCHNGEDREGELSLESFREMLKGGEHGAVLMPGDSKNSRLIRVLTGLSKPAMPPRRSPAPPSKAVSLLAKWIDEGALGPKGAEPVQTTLTTPDLPAPRGMQKAITAMAYSPNGKQLAVARFREVEIRSADQGKLLRKLGPLPGKVHAVEYVGNGSQILTASGIAGLHGEATLFDVETGKVLQRYQGHRDTLYDATMSPNGNLIATAGYDRSIILWDRKSGKQIRTLKGHNGAIYDLAFHPDGSVLASAGADDTVKIWQVSTGMRLDTLGQPLKEQYVVAFSPNGKFILAGGADNRIRVWRLISKTKQRINPIRYSRFAHEGPVIQLRFNSNGSRLISVGEDRTVKLWETRRFTQIHLFERQPDVTPAISIAPNDKQLAVGRMNGSLKGYAIPDVKVTTQKPVETEPKEGAVVKAPMSEQNEAEPNDQPSQATVLTAPATVKGAIHPSGGQKQDEDLFRFQAKAGQKWIIEVNAARSKSPLDSKIAVLDKEGKPILRKLLRAVRDSYITFRGINSATRDCRVHNWEEMDLNQYLYLNGEVVKLHTAPRGPDSGFLFYPDDGNRRCYFDTTANSHALHEPCYVVEPYPPGTKLIPNGLPVFPLYYENDDDGWRQLGKDSRLTFTAPSDGEYLVRVADVRGFGGTAYKYTLTVRPARPDFTVALHGGDMTVDPGSGKEFFVKANRIDGYEGPIQVEIKNLPPGFTATSPLVIEAGHDLAFGTINAVANAPQPTKKNSLASVVTATAMIQGKKVEKKVKSFTVKLSKKPRVIISLHPSGSYVVKPGGEKKDGDLKLPIPQEWVIEPGQTIAATVRIERNGFKGRVQFEALRQNLPHGVIVDNIGLNGLLIVEGQSERTFYLTAAPWVPETTRTFHLQTGVTGKQSSWPIVLHVRNPKK